MLDALIRSKVKFLFSQNRKKHRYARILIRILSNTCYYQSFVRINYDEGISTSTYSSCFLRSAWIAIHAAHATSRLRVRDRQRKHQTVDATGWPWHVSQSPFVRTPLPEIHRFDIFQRGAIPSSQEFRGGGDFYLWPFEMITTVFSIFSDSLNPWYSSNAFFHAIKSTSLSFDNSSVDSTETVNLSLTDNWDLLPANSPTENSSGVAQLGGTMCLDFLLIFLFLFLIIVILARRNPPAVAR